MKNVLNEVNDIPQVIIKTSLPLVKMIINNIIEEVITSSTGEKCKICGKSYSSVFNLNKHMRNVHNEMSQNKYYSLSDKVLDYPTGTTCNICNKSYSSVSNLIKQGETVWATIRSEEKRFFKIIKHVKNQDKSDLTIFNSKKVLYHK